MNQRRLVGMSMGARKRAARAHFMRWNYEMSVANRAYVLALFSPWDAAAVEYKRLRGLVRIGQRLRPCPGCQECGVRRFTKPEGFFSDNTHYVEIRDSGKVRLWRLKHTPILWRSKCGPRSIATTFYDLEYCVRMVNRFEWIELTQPNLCDGSGVIPARARKVWR